MSEQQIPIQDLIRDVLSVLEKQGYKIHNTRKYNTVYRGLAQYCQKISGGKYSLEIGETFIESLRNRKPTLSKGYLDTYITAVERANHIMEGDDEWYPRKATLEYQDSPFKNAAKIYDEYLRNSGKTKSDVHARMHVVLRFLRFVDLAGVKDLSKITAPNIYEAFQEVNDKAGFHKCVSAFLRYAYRHKLTAMDFSVLVPSTARHTSVPTVYSPEEVEKIIETSAQSKSSGKRNKAIVLIAARIGLRSCDIANLKFENIHRDRKTIELTQMKTKESLVLPLLPEVLNALDDYIEFERPKSESMHIFLCAVSPVGKPINSNAIYNMVSRIVNASGVDVKGRRCGAHALRSSLATALLNEGYNHGEVQDALGHKSPNCIKCCVKTEVDHLRNYALAVPRPSGSFAANLGMDVNK